MPIRAAYRLPHDSSRSCATTCGAATASASRHARTDSPASSSRFRSRTAENHMGRIGSHLPAGRHQSVSGQPLQQRVQHHLIQAAGGDPGPELAQDRVVEARIRQVQAQRVLPVDPGAHRFGGLPVGQIFRHLEDRHQGQAARRPARLATFPVSARELLISQPLTELVTDHHRQRALALALVHHRNGRDDLRRGLRPRLRLHRHHGLHLAAGTWGKSTAARSCRIQDPKRPRRAAPTLIPRN